MRFLSKIVAKVTFFLTAKTIAVVRSIGFAVPEGLAFDRVSFRFLGLLKAGTIELAGNKSLKVGQFCRSGN